MTADRTSRPAARYAPFPPVGLTDRRWPDRTMTASPRWLSTDLRDGNQALAVPMDPARKLAMFELLVGMGYREIEIGFPVASQDDHDFVRLLVEQDRIPDDVRISVLVPARPELIERTVRSLRGAPRATVHLYNATSPLFRELVFGMTRAECRDLAVRGTQAVLRHVEALLPECDVGFQYSPEMFAETELDFALEVCDAVMDTWQVGPGRDIVLNFPTTVERATPNIFADQIEWLDRNLSRRQHVCLSIHPHNDRGTGVATAELAMLAGAERVEGCLFGNGERAGNVCLVTLGLNLLTQGIDPGIDFSDLNGVRRTVEHCNQVPVHPRHPYGGELVYTAFSGSHQDAIRKGFDELRRAAARTGTPPAELPWRIPYLPVDPEDVGRTYEAIVRLNSQSGKGGVGYVLASRFGLRPPRELLAEFARTVQAQSDATGGEVTPDELRQLFLETYAPRPWPSLPVTLDGGVAAITLHVDGLRHDLVGQRAGEVERMVRRLADWGIDVCAVHHCGDGSGAGIAVYAECQLETRTVWGVGLDQDAAVAAFAAVRSANTRMVGGNPSRPRSSLFEHDITAVGG